MRLITQEFEMAEVLRNSDGDIINELGSDVFVAIYELADGEEFDLQDYLDKMHDGYVPEKQVVMLPKAKWDAIHDMMLRNYDIKSKSEDED